MRTIDINVKVPILWGDFCSNSVSHDRCSYLESYNISHRCQLFHKRLYRIQDSEQPIKCSSCREHIENTLEGIKNEQKLFS
jgi:hypothetical protein